MKFHITNGLRTAPFAVITLVASIFFIVGDVSEGLSCIQCNSHYDGRCFVPDLLQPEPCPNASSRFCTSVETDFVAASPISNDLHLTWVFKQCSPQMLSSQLGVTECRRHNLTDLPTVTEGLKDEDVQEIAKVCFFSCDTSGCNSGVSPGARLRASALVLSALASLVTVACRL